MFHKIVADGAPQNQGSTADSPDFLMDRIAQQAHYSDYAEPEARVPRAPGSVSAPRDVGRYSATAAEIPLVQIRFYPGVATYRDMSALITADGAPVPPTGPGSYGQLYAAGRSR